MGPYLDADKLPNTITELNREQRKRRSLIREQQHNLKEAHKEQLKMLGKVYLLESTRDNKKNEGDKKIANIEQELYRLNATHDFL